MGFLVSLEGIDGTGKSTIAAALRRWCEGQRLPAFFSSEPTTMRYGQQLRDSAMAGRLSVQDEVDLFLKDRVEHIALLIRPALDAGATVILDRYYWSNAAYQGARGADVEEIIASNEQAVPVPDLILLFDLPVEMSLQRICGRGDSPNAFERPDMLFRARNIFLSLHASGKYNSVLIDAKDTPEGVMAQATNAVQSLIENRRFDRGRRF